MARSLLLAAASSNGHAGTVGVVTLLLCVVAVAMCASHGRKRWSRLITSRRAGPLIEFDMDPRIQPGEDVGINGGQVCVWQKKILMGEKCQQPDFSGIITYDSDGKLITSVTSRIAMK